MSLCVISAGRTRSTLPQTLIILISSNITTGTIAAAPTDLGLGIKRSLTCRRTTVPPPLKALRHQPIKNSMLLRAIMEVVIKSKAHIMEGIIETQVILQIKLSRAASNSHIALHNPQVRTHTANLHSAESDYYDCLMVSLCLLRNYSSLLIFTFSVTLL